MIKKVLIVAPIHDVLAAELNDLGYHHDLWEDIDTEQALAIIPEYEGIITSTRLQIDKTFIDRAINLKWIGRMGSGMEVIDVPYAVGKGISCFSSPEGNANAVAEQALGMLLALQHKIFSAHIELEQGVWLREENRGVEIEGLTAGIIGYGNNGSAFAKKLRAMKVKVLALDKYRKDYGEEGIVECIDLDRIYNEADIISFHLPLTEETMHYFNNAFLGKMQHPFVLLNLSRGKIVAQESLFAGMKSGKIKGAALDVWEKEPLFKMEGNGKEIYPQLLAMPNFIGTPHIGGYTVQALYKMSYFLAQKIRKSIL